MSFLDQVNEASMASKKIIFKKKKNMMSYYQFVINMQNSMLKK